MTLRILAETYLGNERRQAMAGDAEARAFQDAVQKAFEKIRACCFLGDELIKDINGADCDLSIVKAGAGQTNSCVLQQQTSDALDRACYREVLDQKLLYAKIQQLLNQPATGVTPDHPAVKKFVKFYVGKDYMEKMKMLDQKRTSVKAYPIAHKSQDPIRKDIHTAELGLRRTVSYSVFGDKDDAKAIDQATGHVRSLQNGLAGYHIMTHLTPGPGVGAFVVWNPEDGDAGADLDPSQHAAWMKRPNWIALVHEMIHGWRLVTGQCVFRPTMSIEDYYEEAMTVGLLPYDECKFTENRFRMFAGEPRRSFYGPKTKIISDAAQQKHEWPKTHKLYNLTYHGLPSSVPAKVVSGEPFPDFETRLRAELKALERTAIQSSLRVFVVYPHKDVSAKQIVESTLVVATDLVDNFRYRLQVTPFLLEDVGRREVRIHYA